MNMKNEIQKAGIRSQGKKRTLFGFFLLLAVCCCFLGSSAFAADAGGSEVEGKHFSAMDWVWKVVNFAILVILLVKFAGKPLKNFLQQRKELIEKSIRDSQEAKELARKALAEVEERLKLKDKEVEEIISLAKSSGEAERDRLTADGERLTVRIIEQAKSNIDHEVKTAKEAIKAEAVEAAMKAAEEKIRARMTKEEQDRLLQESIKLLEGRN
jgi:F-type H+-transporting ATPase subunit b